MEELELLGLEGSEELDEASASPWGMALAGIGSVVGCVGVLSLLTSLAIALLLAAAFIWGLSPEG